MLSYTCFIIDSDHHHSQILGDFISVTPELLLIENTRDDDISFILTKMPDLTFLNIDNLNENSLFHIVYGIYCNTSIIPISTKPDLLLAAYERYGFDYLLHPFTYEKFLRSVTKTRNLIIHSNICNRCEKGTLSNNSFFYLPSEIKGRLIRVLYDEVLYVESLQNYVIIQTKSTRHLGFLNLKEIEDQLPGDKFIRIHKSFIVNINHIQSVHFNSVVLDNKEIVNIGSTYRTAFSAFLEKNLVRSKRR